TLDTLGPLARTCDDAWALYLAMAAESHRELAETPDRLVLLAPTTLMTDDLDPAVNAVYQQALERYEAMGHEVRVGELPLLAEALTLYRTYGSFASHEAWALYEDELTHRAADMDPRVTARIHEFAKRPSSDYIRLGYA